MPADVEINSRCAVAALNVLRRELERTECTPEDRDRLDRLARMAWEPIAEMLGDKTASSGPETTPTVAIGTARAGTVCQDAAAAWEHAAGLRRSTSRDEAAFHAERLTSIAASASNVLVVRVCRQALGSCGLMC